MRRAEFSTSVEGSPQADDWVIRRADVIFRADDYDFPDDQGGPFSMTPAEIRAYCQSFKDPVEVEDTHVPSIFNGKLGHLIAVQPSADHATFGGDIKIPGWFHRLFPNEPIKLSPKFDRATKTIKKLAVVPNPRITDAAMFAAFAEDEALKKGKTVSPHGQKLLQYIHDMTAHHGATCKEEHSPALANLEGMADEQMRGATAKFHAAHESSAVQKIHDLTLGSGAACALYRENLGRNKDWKPGQSYSTAVEAMPAYRDYQPGRYVMMSDSDAPRLTVVDQPAPTARELELERRLAEAERQNEAHFAGRIAAEAVTFAEQLYAQKLCLPAEKQSWADLYRAVAQVVHQHRTTAEFSDVAGQRKTGTALDVLKALVSRLRPNVLTQELIPGEHAVLFSNETGKSDEEKEMEAAKKSVEAHAERRNKAIRGSQRKPRGRGPAGGYYSNGTEED